MMDIETFAQNLRSSKNWGEEKYSNYFLRCTRAQQVISHRPVKEIWHQLDQQTQFDNDPEFGLFLLHECVVRGESVPDSARRYQQWATEVQHPFSVLPLHLLPDESALPEIVKRRLNDLYQDFVRLDALIPGIGDAITVDDERKARIEASFESWTKQSNGMIDIRQYSKGGDFPTTEDQPPLRRDAEASLLPFAFAVGTLFATSFRGGAYSYSENSGALSRLQAWKTISGMIGAQWPSALDRLANEAQNTRWIALYPDDPWFCRVAWDQWLLVELDDSIMVVAASDTD